MDPLLSPNDFTTSPALPIGAVAKATGVPVETLRTWERRYGFPPSVRDDKGHRRYLPGVVEHVRWVHTALSNGHRAKDVVKLTLDEVKELVASTQALPPAPVAPVAAATPTTSPQQPLANQIPRWIDAVTQFDADGLVTLLRRSLAEWGARRFVTEGVGPFLVELGEAWDDGRLDVAHEHFASEHLRQLLQQIWQRLEPPSAPAVVVATLPGEEHDLGAHMAACAAAWSGHRVVFLGRNAPLTSMVQTVAQLPATALLISCSLAAPADGVERGLRQLQQDLPKGTKLIAGGAGARHVDGVYVVGSLDALAHELQGSR